MQMHSFQIDADRETGEWIEGTAVYLGLIDSAAHYAKVDTDEFHYDQHDGEGLDWPWDSAPDDVERTRSMVALTIRHV
jgi:hypothetical protein